MYGRILHQKPFISFKNTDKEFIKTKKISNRISQRNKFRLEDWYWSFFVQLQRWGVINMKSINSQLISSSAVRFQFRFCTQKWSNYPRPTVSYTHFGINSFSKFYCHIYGDCWNISWTKVCFSPLPLSLPTSRMPSLCNPRLLKSENGLMLPSILCFKRYNFWYFWSVFLLWEGRFPQSNWRQPQRSPFQSEK